MAGFTFQYETLLEQRRRTERQRQRELAEVQQQAEAMKQQLRDMQHTVDASKRQLRDDLTGRVNLGELGSVTRYSAQVTFRGQQLVQKLASQQKQVERARQRLMHATQQRQILERLKEKHHERWLWHQRRNERRQQDELATQMHLRNHGSEPRP